MNTYIKERREEGFTLIELLIAIVVVGILTAVVIVGIGGLNDNGKKSACQATADAAKAASAVYYSNQTPNAYPANLAVMEAEGDLDRPSGVAISADSKSYSNGWTMTMDTTGPVPTFSCP
jgi:prepilin-type N-terminal cleavage/methylation domain-containing protein